jgi:hypothetical protein
VKEKTWKKRTHKLDSRDLFFTLSLVTRFSREILQLTKDSFDNPKLISIWRLEMSLFVGKGFRPTVWIEEMILMKNFSQNFLWVQSQGLYKD